MINAYPGDCRFCRKRVAARAGFTELRRGIWLVWHASCAPETDRPRPTAAAERPAPYYADKD
jgi:hypothetical protein